MKWDYDLEDPHLDARGFRARELLQDTDESAYYEIDKPPAQFEEIKSDLVLSNGARFYNDHAHPEYSTPECTTLREIVAQDKRGNASSPNVRDVGIKNYRPVKEVRLYKNNTDFVGHSYGCHDNYLITARHPVGSDRRATSCRFLSPARFLPARARWESKGRAPGEPGVYQISQRSDFFSVLVSIDTMNRRPLMNTRDEPHADREKLPAVSRHHRRLQHEPMGDGDEDRHDRAGAGADREGQAPQLELAQPIEATKSISRDQTCDWIIELEGRTQDFRDRRAATISRALRREHVTSPPDDEHAWILREWETVLNDLHRDPMQRGTG